MALPSLRRIASVAATAREFVASVDRRNPDYQYPTPAELLTLELLKSEIAALEREVTSSNIGTAS